MPNQLRVSCSLSNHRSSGSVEVAVGTESRRQVRCVNFTLG